MKTVSLFPKSSASHFVQNWLTSYFFSIVFFVEGLFVEGFLIGYGNFIAEISRLIKSQWLFASLALMFETRQRPVF